VNRGFFHRNTAHRLTETLLPPPFSPATPFSPPSGPPQRRFQDHLAKSKFLAAEDSSDEDGKFSLGFRVTFDRSHSPTKLKVTCRVSKVTTDEIECSVDDPSQPKLPL
jgi:hypothetical protein